MRHLIGFAATIVIAACAPTPAGPPTAPTVAAGSATSNRFTFTYPTDGWMSVDLTSPKVASGTLFYLERGDAGPSIQVSGAASNASLDEAVAFEKRKAGGFTNEQAVTLGGTAARSVQYPVLNFRVLTTMAIKDGYLYKVALLVPPTFPDAQAQGATAEYNALLASWRWK